MATISAAKHQHSDKSLKVDFIALKELEKGTSHKDVASLFGVPKNVLSTWIKAIQKSSSRMKMVSGLKEQNQKNMWHLTRD